MEVNNEIRRTKAKLSLFNNDMDHPFMQVMIDLIEQMEPDCSEEYKLLQLSILRANYAHIVAELDPGKPDQGYLFIVK